MNDYERLCAMESRKENPQKLMCAMEPGFRLKKCRLERDSNSGPLDFDLLYEGISKSFEPNMERARNLDLFCFIFQRSPLPTPHTCPI